MVKPSQRILADRKFVNTILQVDFNVYTAIAF